MKKARHRPPDRPPTFCAVTLPSVHYLRWRLTPIATRREHTRRRPRDGTPLTLSLIHI